MMQPLAIRETEIFRTLKELAGIEFVLIGGYAVNVYVLPRFSVDADIVVRSKLDADAVAQRLSDIGYEKVEAKERAPYHGEFVRYEKVAVKGFMVSVDLLIGKVVDRQSGASLSAEWVFGHSSPRLIRGKTATENIRAKVPTPDCLVVMKLLSCRATDIRDVFMLLPQVKDFQFVRDEVSQRADIHVSETHHRFPTGGRSQCADRLWCVSEHAQKGGRRAKRACHPVSDRWSARPFDGRLAKFKQKVLSPDFKNNLQGVYGFVDNEVFERHKRLVLKL
ncbi:nucleotidyl transferase AbiEii/AbiGii toxin family protein [Candidatus Woesearchaeota archaeon]|nr:nucleotidyl transferase AbiEii/AbiGii toxin family protein [Candidatus Woesearchaeota archaeon]